MSYDVWLQVDTGGPEPARVGESQNYTSNVSDMWRKALGRDLSDLDGMTAQDAIADLERAVSHMRHPDNAAEYHSMNPRNGWGNHEGATKYLEWLLAECRRHPKATIAVCW